ncbi:protein of unknown function [Moritella yayanosii]|uniref:Uncharacterized protein n=1 Tax=Moritella yayanosii TaxID=69539 RepID=A0A330LK96_9GAMM|nr:protein of unknown function [Moritella yayanosii]
MIYHFPLQLLWPIPLSLLKNSLSLATIKININQTPILNDLNL